MIRWFRWFVVDTLCCPHHLPGEDNTIPHMWDCRLVCPDMTTPLYRKAVFGHASTLVKCRDGELTPPSILGCVFGDREIPIARVSCADSTSVQPFGPKSFSVVSCGQTVHFCSFSLSPLFPRKRPLLQRYGVPLAASQPHLCTLTRQPLLRNSGMAPMDSALGRQNLDKGRNEFCLSGEK